MSVSEKLEYDVLNIVSVEMSVSSDNGNYKVTITYKNPDAKQIILLSLGELLELLDLVGLSSRMIPNKERKIRL